MGNDIPIYHVINTSVTQIKQTAYPKERALQQLFEEKLETLLGVRFVASEFTTGDRQREAERQAEILFQSFLQHSFHGEL